uniref:Huntingtin-interacting protein K-like n=1 Tax=Phallusia mammillata TaxID=59560 RepID=A0A6F9DFK8_9ASCI|nr:huntingtin-interacting protein K-like [Phallusia mammillata]
MDGEEDPQLQDKKKKHDTESAADLERVTDYAEEKEINLRDVGDVLANLGQTVNAQQAARERELAQVKISKEDVELIMSEMEITKIKAERVLRENKGNVVQALVTLVNS